MKLLLLVFTHSLFAIAGFGLGIYALPILTAPEAPTEAQMSSAMANVDYTGEFKRDLEGSDFFHWGEGTLSVGKEYISLSGSVAAGPDYKLYLSPVFVETEEAFNQAKSEMVRVGDVKTFDNFIVAVPEGIDPSAYTTAVVWCESFGEFITAAQYR